jgi:steroid delta-isomerase-like uncharacterized protein
MLEFSRTTTSTRTRTTSQLRNLDLKAAIACVQLCREIGNSAALRPFTKREVTPGNLKGAALDNFIRDSVVTYWHDQFTFTDHALGLEFKDKERLNEFLAKIVERFPDSERRDNSIFSSADRVISEWTLTATLAEPFLGGRLKVPICVRGISVVQVKNGKISQWSDYYDQLKSRRYGVAALFTEWIEL